MVTLKHVKSHDLYTDKMVIFRCNVVLFD